jgi:lipoprotein NlpI
VDAFSHRGFARKKLKDYTAALADFDKAIDLNPKESGSYVDRGLIKNNLKDYDGALADFNMAIELNTNNPVAYEGLGATERHFKNYGKAMDNFNKAIEINPQDAWAYACRGYLQNDLLQWQQALESFRKSLELDSSLDYSRLYIWLIRAQLGEQEAATKELADYLNSSVGTKENDWPIHVGKFLIGTLSEEDVINVANRLSKNLEEEDGQLCEAYYYIGMKHLLDGDKSGAVDFLQKCLDTGETRYLEYESAETEIQKLKVNNKKQ